MKAGSCRSSIVVLHRLDAQKLIFNEEGTLDCTVYRCPLHTAISSRIRHVAINRVDAEKPDMVIFTGDVVTGRPVKEGWDAVTRPVIDRKIPFAVTFGNHDDEQGMTRLALERLITSYPYNCNYPTGGEPSGVLNNVIPVYGGKSDMEVKGLIYCFDSGAYSTVNDVSGYGWITTEIIEWYKKQSLRFTRQNSSRYLHWPFIFRFRSTR